MVSELFANFATSQIATTPMAPTDTSFSVTANTGTNFPLSGLFTVTIDTEVLLIGSRTADTFIVVARGFDGSSAASHVVGASVQLCATSYSFRHLWSNVADTYVPEVPPTQAELSAITGLSTDGPSQYDNEFESAGNWTLYPSSPTSGTSFDIGNLLQSHLLLNRYGVNDNGLYTAYQPFPVTGPFTLTCKLSDAVNVPQNGSGGVVESHFFVSDRVNPTASGDDGNRFRIDVVTKLQQYTNTVNNSRVNVIYDARYVRCSVNINSVWYEQSPIYPVALNQTLYLRINTDGNGNWNAYIGDGYTYTLLVNYQNLSISCQSMGLQFFAQQISPYYVSHTAAIDYVRADIGVQLPAYGS